MPYAQFDGLNFWYEIRGNGPRLLFISGTGGDLRRAPNAFAARYPDRFETLAYDQRGMGRSAKPDIAYSMAQYADDAALLLDAVGWDRCLVIGYSFGGMVAQEFALRHPSRVARLVIAGATAGGAGGSSFAMERFQDMPQDEMLKLRIATMDTRRDTRWRRNEPEEFRKAYDQALAATQFGRGEPGSDTGARRQLEARAKHDTFDRLPQLTMPVLVCGGIFDGVAAMPAVERMARKIPGAEFALFEDGHYFIYQDPAAQERIAEFLLCGATHCP